MEDLTELAQNLGVPFKDPSLLLRALTHRSYLNENASENLEDNERLEFLGDAVLDFLVGAHLYQCFPKMAEGELTSLRAALVRTKSLAQFARELGVGRFLRLGLGEAENGGRDKTPILCAAFEAIIGAIYLTHGLDEARRLTERLITPALEEIIAASSHKDGKSEFQVWAQAQFNVTPHYEVVASAGPDHAKVFTVHVFVADDFWGQGHGSSKQVAAQAAANEALLRVASWTSKMKKPPTAVKR